ncbi:hypothetical protein NP233_g7514 [Leucocoprinus birnbaumii]|uniref:Helicase C-terminal domain-containing protein n=1 Tax=Leucocoprinus birnbaumii TaxID=56174 RepID=A0AAD5VP16_9AGAR|nr:hypothetical protein NP233_g7514 [Leucocoprinus birnbaumii]
MTATPLLTGPRDIASMGHLVGINHFSSSASIEEEKDDKSRLNKLKRANDKEGLTAERLKIVVRHQNHCKGHFLRRTTTSSSFEDKPLIDIPPYREIIVLVRLTERELEIIEVCSEAAKADVLSSSDARIFTKKFYLEYRLTVAFARRAGEEGMLPKFHSLAEWEPKMSSKMEYCAQICEYQLIDDRVLDIICKDGEIEFPDVPEEFLANPQRTRRIIIYSEFPSLAPLLQNVLSLHGVESLAINGKTSLKDRDLAVKHLYDDNHPAQTLIFSSVGSAGLNLAIADVDQPWSSQDEYQIIGRAHRQPQQKEVKVYYLHAMDSADSLIWQMARGKSAMFDAFVNKKRGAELQALLQGKVLDDDDGDDPSPQEIPAGDEPPAETRQQSCRRVRQIITDDNDEAVQSPAVHVEDSEVSFQTPDGEENERPPSTTASNVSSPRLSYKSDTEADTTEDDAPRETQYESPDYTDYDNTPGRHDADPIGPEDDDVDEYDTRGKRTSQRELSRVEDVEMEGVMTDPPHFEEDDEMEGVMPDLPHFEDDEILHSTPFYDDRPLTDQEIRYLHEDFPEDYPDAEPTSSENEDAAKNSPRNTPEPVSERIICDDQRPPTKCARQGTIGDEGCARIRTQVQAVYETHSREARNQPPGTTTLRNHQVARAMPASRSRSTPRAEPEVSPNNSTDLRAWTPGVQPTIGDKSRLVRKPAEGTANAPRKEDSPLDHPSLPVRKGKPNPFARKTQKTSITPGFTSHGQLRDTNTHSVLDPGAASLPKARQPTQSKAEVPVQRSKSSGVQRRPEMPVNSATPLSKEVTQRATSSTQPNRQPVPPANEQRGRTISLPRPPPANSNPENEPMVPTVSRRQLLNSQPTSSTSRFTTAARSMSASAASSGRRCQASSSTSRPVTPSHDDGGVPPIDALSGVHSKPKARKNSGREGAN